MTDHKHAHPVQPPHGSIFRPGPCRICGTTYERARAEKALADAQAAMAATDPEGTQR